MYVLKRSIEQQALTRRELQVLWLIAQGHQNLELAEKLHIAPRTLVTS